MKSILGMFLIVGLMSGLLYAKPVGSNSFLPYSDSVLLGCDTITPLPVALSSSTASVIRPANALRKGIEIRNDLTTSANATVYLSTYAATSTTSLYPLYYGSTFKDDTMPYTGAWYGLASVGISSSSVFALEKH